MTFHPYFSLRYHRWFRSRVDINVRSHSLAHPLFPWKLTNPQLRWECHRESLDCAGAACGVRQYELSVSTTSTFLIQPRGVLIIFSAYQVCLLLRLNDVLQRK